MEDSDSSSSNSKAYQTNAIDDASSENNSMAESGSYWRMRHDNLLRDYEKLHKLNQILEDRLLNVVDSYEKKKQELIANTEYEKSTLMADVNKLSTKLVDARIKLHDYEEKELLKGCSQITAQQHDPNII